MDALIHDLQLTRDGAAILSLRVPLSQIEKVFDELEGEELTLDLKKKRKRRSLSANAYAWVLMNKIAEKSGVASADIYRAAVRDVGGNMTPVCVKNEAVFALRSAWAKNGAGWVSDTAESKIEGCTVVMLYTGSSEFDTAQMSRMIDNLIEDARSLDIETMPPQELAGMLESWEAKKHG